MSERWLRCAIYTRKSTEEGLEQSFNTLQAQREAGEAYILSHKQEGWRSVPTLYDDGGWSGASLERPALRRLLADVEARRIDCVVVYKVDRLSRFPHIISTRIDSMMVRLGEVTWSGDPQVGFGY